MKEIIGIILLATLTVLLPDLCPAAEQDRPAAEIQHFGGPSSVGASIERDNQTQELHTGKPLFESYFDFKKGIADKYGLSFGFDYNALGQWASASLGEDTAAGGSLRIFGNWTLLNRNGKNSGTLTYKVENRHKLGTDIAPQDLGFEVGYVGLTAVPFSDIGWALNNLFWNQQLMDNRLAFVAGYIDVTDYINVYSMVDPWTAFSNLAFSTDPTIPAPNQGLSAAVSIMATDRLYLLGGIADANGDPTQPGEAFDSFFNDNEYFSHLEIGLIKSRETRFSDNMHLTYWHADERVEAEVPAGWGLAFSFSTVLDAGWQPFLRLAYADEGGALWERSASVGLGYHVKGRNDLFGFGFNWGRPSESSFGSDLDDQYTAELFYRFQLFKIFTVTPDLQFLMNPAQNPDENLIVVAGLRIRVSL